METISMTKISEEILNKVPGAVNETEILHMLRTENIGWKYMSALKSITSFDDLVVSLWLNISEKTFREYAKPKSTFKGNTREHILSLLSLYKHGIAVFSSIADFENWLDSENFFFDGDKPSSFLNTVTGIKFTDDRLTALEHGDNV